MWITLIISAFLLQISSSIEIPESFQKSNHTNNWAVLVDTSRFWFNYRHVANVLSIYRSVKRLGIPDSQIILMISDDMACNPRNPRPATIFNNADEQINVYGDDVEVDYRGYEGNSTSIWLQPTQKFHGSPFNSAYTQILESQITFITTGNFVSLFTQTMIEFSEPYFFNKLTLAKKCFQYMGVSVENFVRLLTGRLPPDTPRSKRLLTDEGSNILIYLTGHGGDGFLKFQDSEEITSQELADAFEQMWQKRRYNEIFFVIDTCQASSMYEKFYSPNILATASSLVGEDSLSHHVDSAIGVYIIDRYTYYVLEFLENVHPESKTPLSQFLAVCPRVSCLSTVGVRKDLFKRDPAKVPITDFFGSVRPVIVTTRPIDILDEPKRKKKTENKTKVQGKMGYLPQFPVHLVQSA